MLANLSVACPCSKVVIPKIFENKVVIITGASSGIGDLTAKEFAKQNANLVLTGRNMERLEKVSTLCVEASPDKLKPLIVIADITEEDAVERIIQKTLDMFGQIDVLVNNAGILEPGTIEKTSLKQFDRLMQTNVRAPYYLTMLAVPHLIKTEGVIVNVSSIFSVRSMPNMLAYSMTKAAIDQFTRCLAIELGSKGIRVNAVNPGIVKTGIQMKSGMNEKDYEDLIKTCENTHALHGAGDASEVAAAILFLASKCSSNITGVTLPVDGGFHAMCPR